MLSVDDTLTNCRDFARFSGEEREFFTNISPTRLMVLAESVERLLVELQIARWEAERYREELQGWGIPAKRAMAKRLEKGGFDIGWE